MARVVPKLFSCRAITVLFVKKSFEKELFRYDKKIDCVKKGFWERAELKQQKEGAGKVKEKWEGIREREMGEGNGGGRRKTEVGESDGNGGEEVGGPPTGPLPRLHPPFPCFPLLLPPSNSRFSLRLLLITPYIFPSSLLFFFLPFSP